MTCLIYIGVKTCKGRRSCPRSRRFPCPRREAWQTSSPRTHTPATTKNNIKNFQNLFDDEKMWGNTESRDRSLYSTTMDFGTMKYFGSRHQIHSGQDQQLKKIGPGKIKWTRKKCFSNTALTVIKESVDYLNYTQYTFKTRHSDSDFPDPDPSFTQIKDSYFSIGSTLVLTLTSIFSRSSFQSSANRWASSFFIEGCRDWNSADRSI